MSRHAPSNEIELRAQQLVNQSVQLATVLRELLVSLGDGFGGRRRGRGNGLLCGLLVAV